ncbi:hypothetical protein [Rhizobium sp.]|jgi:hypothetical protein|uniref:hypothetical protein n=1 Tax=Rhizobium sp. TaxID=391 RepID=UPI000E81C7FC|nr:hypothetical protein [Rhizobium sp.]
MLRKLLILSSTLLAMSGTAYAQYNPAASCSIGPTEFQSWFKGGAILKNGAVTFADSIAFPENNTKCDFYKWGHQMFLWITSPVGGGINITSAQFYNVNFINDQGVYIQGDDTGVLKGDKTGKMTGMRASVNTKLLKGLQADTIQPGGQAGGSDGLMSINGSLVYYAVHTNDVYAWFNTAVSNGVIPGTAPFPNTKQDRDAVTAYAKKNGVTLNDADALTVEIKTSWIDAAKVNGDLADYVVITADVPNYVGAVGDKTWTISQTQPTITKRIALVGMHVVGTVKGHPEMVWATFEHKANAPNDSYALSVQQPGFEPQTVTVPYNSSGKWNFMQTNGTQDGALVAQMKVNDDGGISATPGNAIQPNNTYRVHAWGGPSDASSANNNTQLVTLNENIDFMLANTPNGKDVRSNYVQVGGVWTSNGSIPSNASDNVAQVGSLLLANATMETYHQKTGQGIIPAFQNGCFGCHNTGTTKKNPTPPPTAISHLFSASNVPLVPK